MGLLTSIRWLRTNWWQNVSLLFFSLLMLGTMRTYMLKCARSFHNSIRHQWFFSFKRTKQIIIFYNLSNNQNWVLWIHRCAFSIRGACEGQMSMLIANMMGITQWTPFLERGGERERESHSSTGVCAFHPSNIEISDFEPQTSSRANKSKQSFWDKKF